MCWLWLPIIYMYQLTCRHQHLHKRQSYKWKYHKEPSSQLIKLKSQILQVKNSNQQSLGLVAKSSFFTARQIWSILSSHLKFWVFFQFSDFPKTWLPPFPQYIHTMVSCTWMMRHLQLVKMIIEVQKQKQNYIIIMKAKSLAVAHHQLNVIMSLQSERSAVRIRLCLQFTIPGIDCCSVGKGN